jgi:hypothetical protein
VKRYQGLVADGTHFDVWGVDSPVPGLAIVQVPPCDCGAELYGVMHIRSGSGLFFAHSAESFGPEVWTILSGVDWTQSAVEIENDGGLAVAAVRVAFGLALNAFHGPTVAIADDVPEYEQLL